MAKKTKTTEAAASPTLVYCQDCAHLAKGFTDLKGFKQATYRCNHPNSTVSVNTWLKKSTEEIHPESRNKDNDCADFEKIPQRS